MVNLFIAISIVIIQILIISMLYKFHKTIAHPSVFIQMFFTVQIVFGLIAFSRYDFQFYGLFWMLISIFLFSLGGILSSSFFPNRNDLNLNSKVRINYKLSRNLLIISMALGICYFIEFYIRNGISISQLINLDSLLELNHEMAVDRYANNVSVTKTSRISLIFVYFSPLIGGFNVNFFKMKKQKILCLLSVLPSLLVMLVINTKSMFIASVLLFISSYIASNVKLNKNFPQIPIKKIIILIISFLSLNYASMMMRVGRFDMDSIPKMNKKFINYALGHIPAFDIWYKNNANSLNLNWGCKTFYGLANFLGISERIQGIYIERVYYANSSTNVFTFFRPLIEDFGPYLGLAVMTWFGFISSYIFYKVRNENDNFISIVFLTGSYFYILYGFITSCWAYMSYTLAFFLFSIYVVIVKGR